VRKALLGPVYPAAAGILMPRLAHPLALISLEVTASRDTPEAVNPAGDVTTNSPTARQCGPESFYFVRDRARSMWRLKKWCM